MSLPARLWNWYHRAMAKANEKRQQRLARDRAAGRPTNPRLERLNAFANGLYESNQRKRGAK